MDYDDQLNSSKNRRVEGPIRQNFTIVVEQKIIRPNKKTCLEIFI